MLRMIDLPALIQKARGQPYWGDPMVRPLVLQYSALGWLADAQIQLLACICGEAGGNNHGADAPEYYPEPPELWPYQREGIAWLKSRDNALLCDMMGLGKSVQGIMAVPTNRPAMILCPLASLAVWVRELERWQPGRPYWVVPKAKDMRFPSGSEIVLANIDKLWPLRDEHDSTRECLEDAFRHCQPNTIVVADEIHLLKGRYKSTRRVKRWRHMARHIRRIGGRTIGLTGTPILNDKYELLNILTSFNLDEEVFPGGYLEIQRLLDPKNKFSMPHPCVKERLTKVMLRRLRRDVFPQMPNKIRQDISVPIPEDLGAQMSELWSRLQQHSLDTMEEFFAALRAEGGIEVFSIIRAALASAKIPTLLELAESYELQDEPVCVASCYRAPIEVLGKREGWGVIHGDISGKNRGLVEDDFTAGKLKGVGFTMQAGGVGISLTRAHHMVINDLPWSPELINQSEDRLRPHLQTEPCYYVYLVGRHPMEEHVAQLLRAKARLISRLIESEEKQR